MQAIILAAGMGKRLGSLTADKTKCMVEVNGISLVERALRQLDGLGLSRIVIVVGYMKERLMDYVGDLGIKTPIEYISNDVYDKTNNIYSLALAKDCLLQEDTLLLESDLIFEESILRELLEDPRDTLALVDKYESWMDGTCVKLRDDDTIEAFVPGKQFVFEDIPKYYKTVNIYKFSRTFSERYYVPFLDAYSKALGNNEYYEQVLRVISLLDEPVIEAKRLSGQRWYEIDDVQDLDIAESIFSEPQVRYGNLQARGGGFWRYPKLHDHATLKNPCFPPQRLVDEIVANASALITAQPSGQAVDALLVAKDLKIADREMVAVAGCIGELIGALCGELEGPVGLLVPASTELEQGLSACDVVRHKSADHGLTYDAASIIGFLEAEQPGAFALSNPNTQTGFCLPSQEVGQIAQYCASHEMLLVIDETLADFARAPYEPQPLDRMLNEYPGVVICKDLALAHGVAGLHVACALSGDAGLIERVRSALPATGVNSLAEFYLQITEKYSRVYQGSLDDLKQLRSAFVERCRGISGLRVLPSQAGFVVCEVMSGISAERLAGGLLGEYRILIEDISGVIDDGRQYVRVALRSGEENEHLADALAAMLQG